MLPRSIYDTQLAEAFLGNEFSISYQSLVSKELGVELVKEETRSNWMRRFTIEGFSNGLCSF